MNSKYINLDANILMEYIYDDANLISEPYEILINTKDAKNSFLSTTSGSLNTIGNQLFLIDPVSRTYGIADTSNYSFLQVNNYSSGFPLRYDVIVLHLPINYTFGNYMGFYLKVYGFDKNNSVPYDLCNFFFDVTNVATKSYINYTNPPFIYNETLWGKEITILIPALNAISSQLNANITIPNSLNFNLTNGVGMSQQSPIFFEFSFINKNQKINNVTTYLLGPKILANVPQVPEFQKLGVTIKPSDDGDYFEICGIYNGTIGEFNTWINNSVYLGNNYYVTYTITTYEQNIRGNSSVIRVTNNFNIPYEFRPIIKYSNTTAVIDVEMNVIDAVDNSSIIRKASYGMLQDEVSKFSKYLTKINLFNASKPVIYNLKNSGKSNYQVAPVNNVTTVEVPFAVLVNSSNVVAKSDSATINGTIFYGEGKLRIVIKPFDTIIKITIAQEITIDASNLTTSYLDLTPFGQIQMVFKNTQSQYAYPLYLNNGDINLQNGVVVFLIPASAVGNIRNIHQSGTNVFYITATKQNLTTVIYSGLFDMYDSITNINNLNTATNLQITTAPPTPPVSVNTSPIRNIRDVKSTSLIANQVGISNIKLQVKPNISTNISNISRNNDTSNVSSGNVSDGRVLEQLIIKGQEKVDSYAEYATYTSNIGGGSWKSSDTSVLSFRSSSNDSRAAIFNISQSFRGQYQSPPTNISYTVNGQTKSITVVIEN